MKKKGDEKDEKNKITKENQSSKQRILVDWFLHNNNNNFFILGKQIYNKIVAKIIKNNRIPKIKQTLVSIITEITEYQKQNTKNKATDWFLHETQHCAEMGWARFNL